MIEVPMEAQPPIAMGFAITPEMQQQALSVGAQDQVPLLDPETAGILATVNSFRVNQRVKFWETMSRGCCEQSNTYDVFDETTGTHLFIAQEVSEWLDVPLAGGTRVDLDVERREPVQGGADPAGGPARGGDENATGRRPESGAGEATNSEGTSE